MALYACRLCLNTESLLDLFELDSDNSLNYKITSCVGVKITPEDHLPSVICESCKRMISHFYDYKLNCLAVDKQLKSTTPSNSDARTKGSKTEEPNLFLNENLNDEIKYTDRTSELDNFTDGYIDDVDDMFGFSPLVNTVIEEDNYEDGNINSHIEIKNTSESTTKRNTEIQCELCGCIFLTKSEFRKHLSTHNSRVKSVQCKYCPKRFTRAENAIIHMRSHLGIQPFICDVCGQTASKIQTLKRHMKIHSDERNYACPQCGCRFKRSGDLFTHMRTHTGARPYKCKLCENDYTSHSGLRKHYKMRHKNNPSNIT